MSAPIFARTVPNEKCRFRTENGTCKGQEGVINQKLIRFY